ncbi:MAG: hypothetical protein SPK43_01525 [Candidatus Onthovivens sp.]|nr:hypothetical protein [Candidatus Onthovivens sp.]
MIKIENTVLPSREQWKAIIMGARNPMNSWDKSDTKFDTNSCPHTPDGYCGFNDCPALGISLCPVSDEDRHKFTMGEKDLSLLSMLSKAGTDHGKFLRMIPIYVDITAPMYWWSEYDTYKVGTVANSCSKMHKIHAKRFEQEDFSIEYLDSYWKGCINSVISLLNVAREKYLETKDKKYWWQMIQLLPASYNQKRTVSLNYQVLKNIYFARKDHKLDEWHTFCDWIKTLPYAKELIFDK